MMQSASPISLDLLEIGRKCEIVEITGGKLLNHKLESQGILPGRIIEKVSESWRHCGPVVIEIDGMQIALGRRMACKIIVKPL